MAVRRTNTNRLTLSALFVALMVVLVYLSAVSPTMSLSILAIAGVISAILVSECGISYAALSYAAASVASLLLVPDKANALMFTVLFGSYPLLARIIESVKKKAFTWLLKIIVANLLFFIIGFLFKTFFFATDFEKFSPSIWLLLMVANAVFLMYDICLKKLVIFYKIRISKHVQ